MKDSSVKYEVERGEHINNSYISQVDRDVGNMFLLPSYWEEFLTTLINNAFWFWLYHSAVLKDHCWHHPGGGRIQTEKACEGNTLPLYTFLCLNRKDYPLYTEIDASDLSGLNDSLFWY